VWGVGWSVSVGEACEMEWMILRGGRGGWIVDWLRKIGAGSGQCKPLKLTNTSRNAPFTHPCGVALVVSRPRCAFEWALKPSSSRSLQPSPTQRLLLGFFSCTHLSPQYTLTRSHATGRSRDDATRARARVAPGSEPKKSRSWRAVYCGSRTKPALPQRPCTRRCGRTPEPTPPSHAPATSSCTTASCVCGFFLCGKGGRV
jgi:hypothetical protein